MFKVGDWVTGNKEALEQNIWKIKGSAQIVSFKNHDIIVLDRIFSIPTYGIYGISIHFSWLQLSNENLIKSYLGIYEE